jgi:hypothetical protein
MMMKLSAAELLQWRRFYLVTDDDVVDGDGVVVAMYWCC